MLLPSFGYSKPMLWSTVTDLRARGTVCASLCAGLVFHGCGAEAGSPTAVRLDAAADGSLRFERRVARATPGQVVVEMANPADIPHAIAIRGGADGGGETVGSGGTSRFDVDLKAGTYELFCPVGAHAQAGMVARLIVGD